jgi:lipid A 3-O-deacylase
MHPRILSRWLLAIAVVPGCAWHTAHAQDSESCSYDHVPRPPVVNLRVDNDIFGSQDQGYSNGLQLTLVSPNLRDYTTDPCIPRFGRWVNRHLSALQPKGFEQQNMIGTFAQGIFTPTDWSRRDLIEDDRPYAAVLLFGVGYNGRNEDRLHTTQLQVGILGPAALGEQAQNGVHGLIGDDKFRGWDNQLENEPVFRIVHERMRKFAPEESANGWGWDAISHYGGSFGNLTTYGNAGGELRFGRNLPDDFGSTPLRPAGENTAPIRQSRNHYTQGAHVFLHFDARLVLNDIALDGNTFRDSHSVDKREAVANIGYGFAWMMHRWKFALARSHSTREFEGQQESPVFGSFTISKAL